MKFERYVDYLLLQPELRADAAALYDGGWRHQDLEELIEEYAMTEEYAGEICELLEEFERRDKEEQDEEEEE